MQPTKEQCVALSGCKYLKYVNSYFHLVGLYSITILNKNSNIYTINPSSYYHVINKNNGLKFLNHFKPIKPI